jgi:hypothetical protein
MTPDQCIALLTRYHPKYQKYFNEFKSISDLNPPKQIKFVNFSAHPTDKKIQRLSVDDFNQFVTEKQGYQFFLKDSFIVDNKFFDTPNTQWHQKVKVSENEVGLGVYAIKTIKKGEWTPCVSVGLKKKEGFPNPFDRYYFDTDPKIIASQFFCGNDDNAFTQGFRWQFEQAMPYAKDLYFTALFTGGLARFINHAPNTSLSPDTYFDYAKKIVLANLEFSPKQIHGIFIPGYCATRDILAGEQLLVTYTRKYWTDLTGYFHITPIMYHQDGFLMSSEKFAPWLLTKKYGIGSDAKFIDFVLELDLGDFYRESILKKDIPTYHDWKKLSKESSQIIERVRKCRKLSSNIIPESYLEELQQNLPTLSCSTSSESDLATLQQCADAIKDQIKSENPNTNKSTRLEDHVRICSFITAHKILKIAQSKLFEADKPNELLKDIFLSFFQLHLSYKSLTEHFQAQNKTGEFFPSAKPLEYKKTTEYLKEYLTEYLQDHPNILENADWTLLNNLSNEIKNTQLSL